MLEVSTPRSLLIMYSPPSFRDRKKTLRYALKREFVGWGEDEPPPARKEK
jgi:hypothetical protein